MDKLLALFAFLASLVGCDGGRDTVVNRIADAGTDVLLSRATVQDGVARFECVRSASGACHYILLPSRCAPESSCAACARRFDVAAGNARQVAGLHAFRLCVDTAASGGGDCGGSTAVLGE